MRHALERCRKHYILTTRHPWQSQFEVWLITWSKHPFVWSNSSGNFYTKSLPVYGGLELLYIVVISCMNNNEGLVSKTFMVVPVLILTWSPDMSTLFTHPALIPWPHTGTYNSPPCDGFETSCQLNTSSDECVRTKLVWVRLTLWACAFVVLTLWYFPALYCRMRDGVTSQATGEPFSL